MKKIWILMLGLLAIVGCKDDDESTTRPATQEQMEALTDNWYAELPMSGETANWRTEEEGDMTTYDHIGVIIYLNGYNPSGDASFWGYLYLQDGDMVNFDGLLSDNHERSTFNFTMDSEGNITPSSSLTDAPQVTNMHYDSEKDIITADVIYKGQTIALIFRRPSEEQKTALNEFWDILIEAGEVGGSSDRGDEQDTDIQEDGATEPSRVKRS